MEGGEEFEALESFKELTILKMPKESVVLNLRYEFEDLEIQEEFDVMDWASSKLWICAMSSRRWMGGAREVEAPGLGWSRSVRPSSCPWA